MFSSIFGSSNNLSENPSSNNLKSESSSVNNLNQLNHSKNTNLSSNSNIVTNLLNQAVTGPEISSNTNQAQNLSQTQSPSNFSSSYWSYYRTRLFGYGTSSVTQNQEHSHSQDQSFHESNINSESNSPFHSCREGEQTNQNQNRSSDTRLRSVSKTKVGTTVTDSAISNTAAAVKSADNFNYLNISGSGEPFKPNNLVYSQYNPEHFLLNTQMSSTNSSSNIQSSLHNNNKSFQNQNSQNQNQNQSSFNPFTNAATNNQSTVAPNSIGTPSIASTSASSINTLKQSQNHHLVTTMTNHDNNNGLNGNGFIGPQHLPGPALPPGTSITGARALPPIDYQVRYLSEREINKYLVVGDSVMPSTHKGQSVCFASYTPPYTPGNMIDRDGRWGNGNSNTPLAKEQPVRKSEEGSDRFGVNGNNGTTSSSSGSNTNSHPKPDHTKVVVKIREKKVSFKDQSDINQWKQAMCSLMVWQRSFKSGLIVEIIDILECPNNFYCLMCQVNGIDMFEFLHRLKIVDDQSKAVFITKVAYQLTAALRDFSPPVEKDTGLIPIPQLTHRDIKLENVVLDDDKSGTRATLKIIDFDTVEESGHWCRINNNNGSGSSEFGWKQNISTDIMGTDQYISPESYFGIYSSSSDIFALGVMLYKLCVGSFPFSEEIFDDEPGQNYVGHPKMRQIALKLRTAKVDFISHPFWNSCEGAVKAKDFISRCLAYEPSKRLNVESAWSHPLLQDYDEKCRLRRWVDFKRVKDVR